MTTINPWSITWTATVDDDERTVTFTGDDLIAADLIDLEILLGDGWRSCDPWASPLHLAALIAVGFARITGQSLDVVREELKQRPATDFVGALTPIIAQPKAA